MSDDPRLSFAVRVTRTRALDDGTTLIATNYVGLYQDRATAKAEAAAFDARDNHEAVYVDICRPLVRA